MPVTTKSNAISVRVKHAHRSRYNNQRQHDLRIGCQPSYIYDTRTKLNRIIIDLPLPAEITERAKELRERTNPIRAMRQDAAVATIGVITFGHAAQSIFNELTLEQQADAYLDVAERIAEHYETTLRGLVIHADETAPHAHVVWDCRNRNGTPMSHVMKGSRLQDIAGEVIARHAPGIERGIRKAERIARGDDPSRIYNRSVRQLHQDLPRELKAKQLDLEKLERHIDEMKARANEFQADKIRLRRDQQRIYDCEAENKAAEAELKLEVQRTNVQANAMRSRERILKNAEIKIHARKAEVDQREFEVKFREQNVTRSEHILCRLTEEVSQHVGDIADHLGVGRSL